MSVILSFNIVYIDYCRLSFTLTASIPFNDFNQLLGSIPSVFTLLSFSSPLCVCFFWSLLLCWTFFSCFCFLSSFLHSQHLLLLPRGIFAYVAFYLDHMWCYSFPILPILTILKTNFISLSIEDTLDYLLLNSILHGFVLKFFEQLHLWPFLYKCQTWNYSFPLNNFSQILFFGLVKYFRV